METRISTRETLQAFVAAYATTRHFIRACRFSEPLPGLWLIEDDACREAQVRGSEVVVDRVDVANVIDFIASAGVGRHRVCRHVSEAHEDELVSHQYKERGDRLLRREPVFVLDLSEQLRYPSNEVGRVTGIAEAEAIAKSSSARRIFPEHLGVDDAVCRLYASFDVNLPAGWVRSIRSGEDAFYVADLYVAPAYRRRGIGRALMTAMLDDDHRLGARWSILLASSAGPKLYPQLGYAQDGWIMVFTHRNGTGRNLNTSRNA